MGGRDGGYVGGGVRVGEGVRGGRGEGTLGGALG